MGQELVLTGMVLNAMPIGDYDKRITILTKERGKITAFARGARRPNSALLAASNSFSFGEFELYEGKSSYTVSKANIKNYFRNLLMDFDATYLGFYFLEFADYYCQENNDEKEMLKLLYQSLRALESSKYNNELVRAIFELKAITINGEGPTVFSCIHCKKKENLLFFSVSRGGLFCSDCRERASGTPVLDATRYTLQYIVASRIEKLYSFAVSDEVLEEVCRIVKDYMKQYARHRFKSLETMKESKDLF